MTTANDLVTYADLLEYAAETTSTTQVYESATYALDMTYNGGVLPDPLNCKLERLGDKIVFTWEPYVFIGPASYPFASTIQGATDFTDIIPSHSTGVEFPVFNTMYYIADDGGSGRPSRGTIHMWYMFNYVEFSSNLSSSGSFALGIPYHILAGSVTWAYDV